MANSMEGLPSFNDPTEPAYLLLGSARNGPISAADSEIRSARELYRKCTVYPKLVLVERQSETQATIDVVFLDCVRTSPRHF